MCEVTQHSVSIRCTKEQLKAPGVIAAGVSTQQEWSRVTVHPVLRRLAFGNHALSVLRLG